MIAITWTAQGRKSLDESECNTYSDVMNMEVSVRHANTDKNAKLKLRDYFLKGKKKADMENPYQLYYYTLSSDTHCQRILLIRDWDLSNCFVKKKLRCFSYGKVESFLIKIGCVNLISLPKKIFIILITVLFFIVGDLFLIYSNSALAVKPSSIKNLVTSLTKKQPEKEEAAKEQAAKEQVSKEQAAKEEATKEQAAKEEAAKEQVAKEQAAKEQAAKEQAAKEQAAKEEGKRAG